MRKWRCGHRQNPRSRRWLAPASNPSRDRCPRAGTSLRLPGVRGTGGDRPAGRQILATLRGQFKTVLDQIGGCHRVRYVLNSDECENSSKASRKKRAGRKPAPKESLLQKKKEQSLRPALKIVSTLFSRKIWI